MARAFLKHLGGQTVVVESAGTMPSEQIDPVVEKVMHEVDIDITGKYPKLITQKMVDDADRVITMGCSIDESCPANVVVSEDWGLDDPRGKHINEVRRIRDEISMKVIELLGRL
jgi:protein-tyrosine-phosphatase